MHLMNEFNFNVSFQIIDDRHEKYTEICSLKMLKSDKLDTSLDGFLVKKC